MKGVQRALDLEPSSADVFGLFLDAELGISGQLGAWFGHHRGAGADLASKDEPLGLLT